MTWTNKNAIKRRLFNTSPFTPLTLTPILWLDSQDSTTMYTDTSESVICAPNDEIGRWKDKSGNSYHADTTGSNPTLIAAAINSYNAALFTGVEGLQTPTMTQSSPQGEIWVVIKTTTLATSIVIETSPGFAGFIGAQEIAIIGSDIYSYYNGSMGYTSCQQSTNTSPHYYRGTVDFSLSTNEASLYTDGSPTSSSTRPDNSNNSNTLSSQPAFIGMRSGGSLFYAGAIGEIIMFDKALTGPEAVSLSSYLSTKWGI